ncbi:MAG: mechanosensitive ion channel [Saprospiraceae bacterium]|nr:mechanosensitive ion channel [Saprospiraceae bacterium]
MLNRIFEFTLFSVGSFDFTVSSLFGLFFIILFTYAGLKLTNAKWRLEFFQQNDVDAPNRRRFEGYLRKLVVLIALYAIIQLLELDVELFNIDDGRIIIYFSIIVVGLVFLVAAWLIEWYFSNILINKYAKDRKEEILDSDENPERVRSTINKLVQYIVIVLASLALINKLGWNFVMWDHTMSSGKVWEFTPSKILTVVFVFLIARIVIWVLTQVALFSLFKRKHIDQGSRFAINQLLKYLIYFIATIIALKGLGIDMTLVLGGAAALLVGIGLGLQQTFNDFFSGLVLLFERSVSVGDIMNVGGEVGVVQKIGLRSSIIETRSNVSIIVPNSKLVNDSVKNWTHFVESVRFEIKVGVAYGSDTKLVKKLLLTATNEHHQVLDYPVPFVRFNDFADSALAFSVYFFTNRYLTIEDIKSDIRFRIDELFKEHDVSIPFPQRDIWVRNASKGFPEV